MTISSEFGLLVFGFSWSSWHFWLLPWLLNSDWMDFAKAWQQNINSAHITCSEIGRKNWQTNSQILAVLAKL